jgi:hypothetical protein
MKDSTFIIDGNNVAFYNSKQPRLQQLVILAKELKNLGKVIIIVSHELQFRIDDKIGLQSSINKKKILQTPKGVDTDLFILETSKKTNGFIISNDHFKQYKKDFLTEISQRLSFMIIQLPQGKYQPILPWSKRFLPIRGKNNESALLSA